MARDALYFLAPLLAAAAAAFWLDWRGPAAGLVLLALFVAFFFRDPERTVPGGAAIVVAPADGRVVRIGRDAEGIRISIFLSIFNVHVNRSPIEGTVTAVRYRKGKFHAAFRDAASLDNEQNTLTIRNPEMEVVCTQIAGVVARRIVCWKRAGDLVGRGERIGLIRFGSRMDVTLPHAAVLQVQVGSKVRAGSTPLARGLATGAAGMDAR